jgi:hypothetical protein
VLGLVQDLVTLISPLNGEVFIRFTSGGNATGAALPVTASSECGLLVGCSAQCMAVFVCVCVGGEGGGVVKAWNLMLALSFSTGWTQHSVVGLFAHN